MSNQDQAGAVFLYSSAFPDYIFGPSMLISNVYWYPLPPVVEEPGHTSIHFTLI